MSVTTYLGIASQILVLVSAFGICMCLYALVFPYIFLLVDCFDWALICHIVESAEFTVLWQF